MNLINQAKTIYKQLDLQKLARVGIIKEGIKRSSHSHQIVAYPPLTFLPEISSPGLIFRDKVVPIREVDFYLHLPFCSGKCLYCAYVTQVQATKEQVERYINALAQEIHLLLQFLYPQKVRLNSIYIGGGTPTFLSITQLNRVFRLIYGCFIVKTGAEITVEVGPETIVGQRGWDKLNLLKQNGVNRLSIGFQSLNDRILASIYRRHDAKQAIRAFKSAQEIGFKNINIDLIMGLPQQTLSIWKKDLQLINELNPASITCYPLAIKSSALLWRLYQKEKNKIFKQENVLLMHIMANEFFKQFGYTQNPVYWFVKQSEKRQPAYKFNKHKEQLSVGVSAYSFINNYQYCNYRNISQYLETVEKGNLPIQKGVKLSLIELMRRYIIFNLKIGLDQNIFIKKFKKPVMENFVDIWYKLEKLGLIEKERNVIWLSEKGKLFADEIAKEFFSDQTK